MTLPIRTWSEQQEHERLMRSTASRCAWLRSLVGETVSLNDASRKFGCPHTTLRRLAQKYGIKFNSGTAVKKSAVDEAKLRVLASKGITARQAAKHFGCTAVAVRSFAKHRGITLTLEDRSVYRPPKPKPPEPKAITGLDVMAMFAARESAAARRQWNR